MSATATLCVNQRKTHLGILPNGVKQTDISLVARNSKFTRLGGSSCREIVLARILLELTLDKLVSGHTRIDSEETVVGWTSVFILDRIQRKTYNDQ